MREGQSACIPECPNRISVSCLGKSLFNIIRNVGALGQVPEQRQSMYFSSGRQLVSAKFKS